MEKKFIDKLSTIIGDRNKILNPLLENEEYANTLLEPFKKMFQSLSEDLKTHFGRDCSFESTENSYPPSLTMTVKYKTIIEIRFRILIEYDAESISIRTQSIDEHGQLDFQEDPIILKPEDRDEFDTDRVINNFIELYSVI